MNKVIPAVVAFVLALAVVPARANLVAFAGDNLEIQTKDASVVFEQLDGTDVLKARLELTEKWAYVRLVPTSGVWDLSAFSGVELRITNHGTANARPGVRIDEAADSSLQAWNSAALQTLAPGETKTFVVKLGMDYHKPRPIDTAKIGAIHISLGKNRTEPSVLTISDIRGVKK